MEKGRERPRGHSFHKPLLYCDLSFSEEKVVISVRKKRNFWVESLPNFTKITRETCVTNVS